MNPGASRRRYGPGGGGSRQPQGHPRLSISSSSGLEAAQADSLSFGFDVGCALSPQPAEQPTGQRGFPASLPEPIQFDTLPPPPPPPRPEWDDVGAFMRGREREPPWRYVDNFLRPDGYVSSRVSSSDVGRPYPDSRFSFDSGYGVSNGASNHTPNRSQSVRSGGSSNNNLVQRTRRPRARTTNTPLICTQCDPPRTFTNPSELEKDRLRHEKPHLCSEPDCRRRDGFPTKNDLERHRKAVHSKDPLLGDKLGYICAACDSPPHIGDKKFWPRKDNFKAHIIRKHPEHEVTLLIQQSHCRRPASASYVSDSALGSQMEDPLDANPLSGDLTVPYGPSSFLSESAPQENEYDLFWRPENEFAGIGTGQAAGLSLSHRDAAVTSRAQLHTNLDSTLQFGQSVNSAVASPLLDHDHTQNSDDFCFAANGLDLDLSMLPYEIPDPTQHPTLTRQNYHLFCCSRCRTQAQCDCDPRYVSHY